MSGIVDGVDARDQSKTELLNAAFNNDVDEVSKILKEGNVHIDAADDDDVTALHIAAALGNINMVRKLLENSANIEACNQLGMTAYHYAAREGHVSVIDILLQRGADYRKLTHLGVSALTLACAGGHADVVKKLLSLSKSEDNKPVLRKRNIAPTPLIVATCYKSSQICNYLTRAGSSPDESIETLRGLSPLSTAILCTPGVYMVASLMDLGASQNKKTLNKKNAMELAKSYKRKDIEHMLNEKRAHKMDSQFDIRTVIKENGLIERVIEYPSHDGCTLLMFATIVKSVNSARCLIQKDIDINAKDNMHVNALQIACLLRVEPIITALLNKSVITTSINKYGLSAYDLFLQSPDVIDNGNIRPYLHCHRKIQNEPKFNLSSSSSTMSKALKKIIPTQIYKSQPLPETSDPQKWLDAITNYQPAKDRNAYKFACVEDILRGTRTARPPETNTYDMITEAMKCYMEEFQSFAVTCFVDFYGDKEEQQRNGLVLLSSSTSSSFQASQSIHPHYDNAQYYAYKSGYHTSRKFPNNSITRKSLSLPRHLPKTETPSTNQMRTTPRMIKKSKDPMSGENSSLDGRTSYYMAQNNRINQRISSSMNIPTVNVTDNVYVMKKKTFRKETLTDDMIWKEFVKRHQLDLMDKLKKEEIDRYSFNDLNESSLREMNIDPKVNWPIIEEIQAALNNSLFQ